MTSSPMPVRKLDHRPAAIGSSLRERTRRAVQAELLKAAEGLFLENGYEATSVDQIALAAGISRRSFFRYFRSKEDLVLGQYERLGEEWINALTCRPLGEPLWISMRRMMDVVIAIYSDEEQSKRFRALNCLVNGSAALKAGQLTRFDRVQDALAQVVRCRAREAGTDWDHDDPAPRAIVGSAFACLVAAIDLVEAKGVSPAAAVDRAMSVMTVRS